MLSSDRFSNRTTTTWSSALARATELVMWTSPLRSLGRTISRRSETSPHRPVPRQDPRRVADAAGNAGAGSRWCGIAAGENHRVDWFGATLECQVANLPTFDGDPGCRPGRHRDEDLARAREGRQSGGRVDRIAEGRELQLAAEQADQSDVGDPGVDSDAERETAPVRTDVGGPCDKAFGCPDREARMIGPGHARYEQTDHLVTDELVDDRVVVDERL